MIFILGGNGFVGSAFVRLFKEKSIDFVNLTRDNYNSYIGKSCEIFINANGNSNKVRATKEPLFDFDASVKSVRRTLLDIKSKSYILLSSCDVYPDCSSPEKTEESNPLSINKQSIYGFHKFLAEQCVQHSHTDWLIFRLGGMVGPNLKKNSIFDILEDSKLWIDPESSLQFIHTDNMANLIMTIKDMKMSNEIFNLCGQGTIVLKDVISFLGKTSVEIKPKSPRIIYNVNLKKISQLVNIPKTQESVFSFLSKCLLTYPEGI